MERVVGLAVEGDIAEIDVAELILRERLKTRQTSKPTTKNIRNGNNTMGFTYF